MSSSTSDKNNSNTNPNGSSAAATTKIANNTNNNPLTKSDKEIVNEEQCDDNYLKCYQENGLDADFYEDDAQLPSLTEEQRLERIEHYRNQVENRVYCPHSLLEVYKGVMVAKSKELEENMQESCSE